MSNKNAIDFAVIGGTGLTEIDGLEVIQREVVHTPFGEPSGQFTHGLIGDKRIVFLARHGYTHTIPPHKVNYRANIWALHHLGVRNVLAVAAVGGITAGMKPQTLVIPDQIIDYTHDRPHTFFDEGLNVVTHIDFSRPYSASMREMVIRAATQAGLSLVENATYAATQGPRLETAAEILRLERDGAHIVGMTG
ncbi:MAG TPA: S-methyl-5'-thioinosine phosphorylase, partial [Thiolinea sp.]|nr:S-methyl-5'-thioinosine phosphorylase [Thiolinea sp.]